MNLRGIACFACAVVWLAFDAAADVLEGAGDVARKSSQGWRYAADKVAPGAIDQFFSGPTWGNVQEVERTRRAAR
jgi:hypothetical protein